MNKAPRTLRQENPRAESSAPRDAIADWLAVFARTLAVPRKEADEILAELEDHLRARVDDLMIGGTPEPQAVREAIKELGETVALAQRFRESHTVRRRRTMLHALALSGAGLAVALSVVTAANNNQNAPAGPPEVAQAEVPPTLPTPPAPQGTEPGAIKGYLDMPGVLAREDEPRITYTPSEDDLRARYGETRIRRTTVHTPDGVEEGPLQVPSWVMLSEIARAADLTLDVQGTDVVRMLDSPQRDLSFFEMDDLPLEDALWIFFGGQGTNGLRGSSFDQNFGVAYRVRENVLEVTSSSGFEEIDAVVQRYDTGDLSGGKLQQIISEFVRPGLGWNRTANRAPSVLGGEFLLVRASPWVHAEVESLLEDLKDAHKRELAEAEELAMYAAEEADREQYFARDSIQRDLLKVSEQLVSTRVEIAKVERELAKVETKPLEGSLATLHHQLISELNSFMEMIDRLEAQKRRLNDRLYLLEVGVPPSGQTHNAAR